MSAPKPEILSMEEVRSVAETHGRGQLSDRRRREVLTLLCATAEHWHREAQGKASVGAGIEALKAAFESTVPRETLAAVVEERDRLRALVAGMREALERAAPIIGAVEDGAEDPPVSLAIAAALVDPDGERAHELASKDREAAEKWRALVEATDEQQDPEHLAFIERATRAIAEAEEEVALLRELETSGRRARWARNAGLPFDVAILTLSAFRARQKEGAGDG